MKIILALDSFKERIPAPRACQIAANGIRHAFPSATTVMVPMADGGEGTAQTISVACAGKLIQHLVEGPLPGMRVEAHYAWLPESRTAVIEMAQASGLALLPPSTRNPLYTTTAGTGELIMHAREKGANSILLTLGGSATVDGGTGASAACGWRFLDKAEQTIPPGGGFLSQLSTIQPPPDLSAFPKMDVLCDVTNPLCGKRGAAHVFAPQKGATVDMVATLEKGLNHLAELVSLQLSRNVCDVPGSGAAGGFGAGAMAFFNAQLKPGIQAVIEAVHLREHLKSADWVVTGEGKLDTQSLHGKVVAGVRDEAKKSNTSVAALAGRIEIPQDEWEAEGLSLVLPTSQDAFPESVETAERFLYEAAVELGHQIRKTQTA